MQYDDSTSYDGRTENGVVTMLCRERSGWISNALCLSVAWLLLVMTAPAQMMPHQNPAIPENGSSSADADSGRREMMEKLEKRRNDLRQEQLVKDTNKLLALATELKSQVDKTNKNMLSVDVVKKAEEIEKLAKNVKDRMRD